MKIGLSHATSVLRMNWALAPIGRAGIIRWGCLFNHYANSSNELQVVNIIALCMQSEIKTSKIHARQLKSSKGMTSKQINKESMRES